MIDYVKNLFKHPSARKVLKPQIRNIPYVEIVLCDLVLRSDKLSTEPQGTLVITSEQLLGQNISGSIGPGHQLKFSVGLVNSENVSELSNPISFKIKVTVGNESYHGKFVFQEVHGQTKIDLVKSSQEVAGFLTCKSSNSIASIPYLCHKEIWIETPHPTILQQYTKKTFKGHECYFSKQDTKFHKPLFIKEKIGFPFLYTPAVLMTTLDTLATLDHPCIPKIAGSHIESHGSVSIILSYVDPAASLNDCLFINKGAFIPLRLGQVRNVVGNLLHVVSYMHTKNIYHGNIDVSSIFPASGNVNDWLNLRDEMNLGEIVLKGFGYVFDMAHTNFNTQRKEFKMDKPAHKVEISSPELLDSYYSEKDDLWAVGIVFLMLLLRRNIFKGTNEVETRQIIQRYGDSTSYMGREARPKAEEGFNAAEIYRSKSKNKITFREQPCWETLKKEITNCLGRNDPDTTQILEILKHIFTCESERFSAEQLLNLPFFTNSPKNEKYLPLDPCSIAYAKSATMYKLFVNMMNTIKISPLEGNADKIAQLFTAMDKNHDGRISWEEFCSAFQNVEGFETVLYKNVFLAADLDKDHYLDWTEFVALLDVEDKENLKKKISEYFNEILTYQKQHHLADSHHKEGITLKALAKYLGIDESRIQQAFKELDLNGDKVIDRREWENMMKTREFIQRNFDIIIYS